MTIESKIKVLVAGGSGYIGSHMTRFLVEKGVEPVIFDLNPPHRALKGVRFIQGDLRDPGIIAKAVKKSAPDIIMYFSGLIVAPESFVKPMDYYDHNVLGAIHLLKAARDKRVRKIIFSSSAAVYGDATPGAIKENAPCRPINPYGWTKLMVEQMLHDMAAADKKFAYISLRYFNAAGAHPSGEMGECHEPETHLIPNLLRAMKGKNKVLTVYGDDYPTKDGTCIRDYIHVQDLCSAHFFALQALGKGIKNEVFNLGSGKGYSVREIIRMAETVTGKKAIIKIGRRRPGDPSVLIASSAKAKKVLGWTPCLGLKEIMESAWAWENKI